MADPFDKSEAEQLNPSDLEGGVEADATPLRPSPPPTATSAPALILSLSPDKAAELEVIKAAIWRSFGEARNYKKNLEKSIAYYMRQGRRLIRAERIVGQGRFMTWVDTNCPFKHRIGNHYMTVANSGLEIAFIANYGLVAVSEWVTSYLGRKDWAKTQTEKSAARKAELQRMAAAGELPAWLRRRTKKRQSLKEKIAEAQARRGQRSQQYIARGIFDLTKLPRPRQDAQTLQIKFSLADGNQAYLYIWLPHDAHAVASMTKLTSALRFHWLVTQWDGDRIVRTDTDNHSDAVVGITRETFRRQVDGVTWEQIETKINEVATNATSLVEQPVLTPADPFTTELLDTWRQREHGGFSPARR